MNWLVCGKVRTFSSVRLDLEESQALLNGESPPKWRMTPEVARQALLDRLESGEASATGRRCWAPTAGALITDSLPSDIPASAWPAFLRIDDETSFAEVKASIPGQGYRDISLKRADVLAAFEAALVDQEPPAPAAEPPPPRAPMNTRDWITSLIEQAKAANRPVTAFKVAWRQYKAVGGGNSRERFGETYDDLVNASNVARAKRGAPTRSVT